MSAGICASCELLRQQLTAERERSHSLGSRVMIAEEEAALTLRENLKLRATVMELLAGRSTV